MVAVNVTFIIPRRPSFRFRSFKEFQLQLIGFLFAGALGGAILAFAVFEWNPTAILQGLAGGVFAAMLIGLMVPKMLSRRMTEALGGRDDSGAFVGAVQAQRE